MITFYPGPSKIYPEISVYLNDAFNSGILSANHRSKEFMAMCKRTISLLHEKLNIPQNYSILFVSSATECWEIILQSFVNHKKKEGSLHFYNGDFGKKWYEFASKIGKAEKYVFEIENEILPLDISESFSGGIICLTQNETSNGTQVDNEKINLFRQKFKNYLLTVDATSSLGGINLNIENADIWFASVQKCLGLPSGLGLLIVSPKAIEKAKAINDQKFYNSFLFMYENILKYQTHYTPNVLNIYLLRRVMEQVKNIKEIDLEIKKRATTWFEFFKNHSSLKPLIKNNFVRSDTIITVTADTPQIITEFKNKAFLSGIILGNGYGSWKNNTLRIANFPQIDDLEIQKLMDVLS